MDPTILLVDDIEDNRITLALHLEICGYSRLLMAADGRESLEKARAQPVDLVLLDIMMPGLDGYGVLQELNAHIVLRHIPVIMISAIEDTKSVVRCIELGATDYLTKPFHPLKARINKCIEQAHYRAQEAAYHQGIEKEKGRADQILSTVLPRAIARKLKRQGRLPLRLYDDVTVCSATLSGLLLMPKRTRQKGRLPSW